jgi:hypothetical protein
MDPAPLQSILDRREPVDGYDLSLEILEAINLPCGSLKNIYIIILLLKINKKTK